MNEQYTHLKAILDAAFEQASEGKGKERHADSKPFEEQDICTITRDLGLGYPLGQARKKINESKRVGGVAFMEKELLGAINYLAAAIIVIREQKIAAPSRDLTETVNRYTGG